MYHSPRDREKRKTSSSSSRNKKEGKKITLPSRSGKRGGGWGPLSLLFQPRKGENPHGYIHRIGRGERREPFIIILQGEGKGGGFVSS